MWLRRFADRHLFQTVDVSTIAVFRIAFGAVMLYWALSFLLTPQLAAFYIEPSFFFTYRGFEWVRPLGPFGMRAVFAAIALSSLGIMLGLWYRAAAAVFTALFTYVFLLDKTDYQNHYYLICLLGAILTLVPAHAALSLDARRDRRCASPRVPAWSLFLLRFQLAVPYIFGAIAKFDSDWLLRAQPMRLFLERRAAELELLEPVLSAPATAYFVSWFGLLFDALIVPALLSRRTRRPAVVALVAFHLSNKLLFHIDVFPFLMLVSTILFFEPDWARVTAPFRRWFRQDARENTAPAARPARVWIPLALYVAVQILVPLRWIVVPGNVSWHEVAHRFSWHMMLRSKEGTVAFFYKDPTSGKTREVDIRPYLSRRQFLRIARSPDMIWQFSNHLADLLSEGSSRRVQVRVGTLISLNGREPKLMIDPNVDLASASDDPLEWMLPLSD